MRRAEPKPFSAEDFRRRVGAMPDIDDAAFARYGDHRLNPDLIEELARAKLREAAVLVPIVETDGDARVILTRRNASLRKHSGQIAFPGGAVDPEDASVEAAALREAQEEIGLDPAFVEPIGQLPHYLTATGFRIIPVLSIVQREFTTTINPEEVDAVFEVPLSFLMTDQNHGRASRIWNGRERHFYTMPYEQWFIWGITAGILRTLYERLYA
ncbi:MAG TPA: CoA pyrophosphatase [Pararhizobium sp.]|nr:CoA pyrophosphatase [Pararhizobium sp.]